MKTAKKSTGLVLGKFMPLTLGHQYLIDFARNYVDELILVIGIRETDPIPGKIRIQWLKEMYPGVQIIRVNDKNPEESHPKYWEIWKKTMSQALPYVPNYLFASEDYGVKLAEKLGMEYIPVDHARSIVPISASKVRENPMKYWQYIPQVVRPYFVKRVCVFGPESTGKSTLTKDLARHFKSVYCEEYARPFLEFKAKDIIYSDIEKIARGHQASESALEKQANKILFSDTDLLTTVICSEIYFGKYPKWIYKEAERKEYDLYLVTSPDVPWVEDAVRYFPKRKHFFNRCIAELKKRKRRYAVISGGWDERLQKAISEVEKIL